ncbi:pectin lyase fold/virulence factor [Desarmillaria tabescens]|uniref:Pectin lyase fold/virulence factor n=1 Tax=Armillaria tabescens TaxID=1929756 RepID=A0AA39K1R1_ARMTA|nr:pectin lyase fold/virulence factor [Desarmillaria tabescens]KAK0452727.1 pectin lyase fold/virulence factor [Desarmillaria tabescens]
MAGNITFTKTSSDGPLFTINGDDIMFNGMGYLFDMSFIDMFLGDGLLFTIDGDDITFNSGNGAKYWDGEGTNGGVDKPHPFLKFKGSGTYSDFTVLNSPAQAISISNSDGLIFDSITVDNSDGDDDDLGHNTDGFNVSADDVTIQNSIVK